MIYRCVARGSRLSRVQVEEVIMEMKTIDPHFTCETLFLKTRGDLDKTTPLTSLDKSNFFTDTIDEMIVTKRADFAVHSAKDLPDPLDPSLVIACITKGVSSSDVLVLKEPLQIGEIPSSSFIGVSSFRREEAVRSLRNDLQPVQIRGDIFERLHLMDEGKIYGLIMAEAALLRLKLDHVHRIPLEIDVPEGQGQLAVVVHKDRFDLIDLFANMRPSR